VDKVSAKFKASEIRFLKLDFVKDQLPGVSLDGILMANSLHFVEDKSQFLTRIKRHLQPGGVFLLVEYDMEVANRWVPYPISLRSAKILFREQGFKEASNIAERPSRFNNAGIYSVLFSDRA